MRSPWTLPRVAWSTGASTVNAGDIRAARHARAATRSRGWVIARRTCVCAAIGSTSCLAAAACWHREPPAPDADPSVASADESSLSLALDAGPPPVPVRAAPPPPSVRPTSPPPDPGTLPQTRDFPSAADPRLLANVAALWTAIATGDPDAGMGFFFPLTAYSQVKNVADPAADWKHRLVAAYARDVHALHSRLGASAARATLVGLDVPAGQARWVEPGEEGNKLGYFRVFGSKLRYSVDGVAAEFDVKSLISWRGEWYVVHLSAIR